MPSLIFAILELNVTKLSFAVLPLVTAKCTEVQKMMVCMKTVILIIENFNASFLSF